MNAVTLAPFLSRDEEAFRQLLASANLPSDDLHVEAMKNFLVARADDIVVGVAGLEQYDNVALLRSVVVAASLRGTGLGKRLVQEIEKSASELGVRHLYLLTTTADKFFARQGYAQVSRQEAPHAIQQTTEFSELCPASSIFMMKTLQ